MYILCDLILWKIDICFCYLMCILYTNILWYIRLHGGKVKLHVWYIMYILLDTILWYIRFVARKESKDIWNRSAWNEFYFHKLKCKRFMIIWFDIRFYRKIMILAYNHVLILSVNKEKYENNRLTTFWIKRTVNNHAVK